MPKITKGAITVSYSPEDIVKLIQDDLADEHALAASTIHIIPLFTGGTKNCNCDSYSGGWSSSSECKCPISPVKFTGYSVTNAKEIEL